MNVLVSDKTDAYEGWVVVRSLQDAVNILGSVDALVYHTSKESSSDKIRFLNDIYKKRTNCKIIYVCSRAKVDNAVRMLVTGGLSGQYVDDEFFLENAKELNTLLADLPMIVDSLELSSSAVLEDFFNRYVSDGSKQISQGYLQVVKRAAIEMTESYHAKSLEMLKMSESAAEIFSSSLDLVSQMRESQLRLESDLRDLQERKVEVDTFNMRSASGASILYFPRVSYLKNRVIIRIKDIGRCTYLTSFIMGFRVYLERVRNVRPKLIIIEPYGSIYEELYSKYKWVTSSNRTDIRNFYDSVVFINYPTSVVITKLLDDTDYDTFVVVDRTVNYKDHILNSRGSSLYSVASQRLIKDFKLTASSCMTVVDEISGGLLTIPKFEGYPDRDDQRVNRYLKDCSLEYDLLYNSVK